MLQSLAIAFGFLTRLPVKNASVNDADLGRSLAWFPIVGVALGLALVGAERFLRGYLSVDLMAVALVVLLAVLTGGLHLDGLADVFDALGGGRGDRERMLTIMKDSRIGAHGAAALCLLLIAKVVIVMEVLRHESFWPLLAFPVLARWAVIPLVIFFPYTRVEGLGKPFNGHGRQLHFAVATCLTAALVAWTGPQVIVPGASALAVALGIGFWLKRRLGGLTGDVYGTAIELSEIIFLVVAGLGDRG
ncbi:adenosylcobinamide-GDP ribazoletransferase [Nitrospira moscoviensis]|jgi:adenosylcobinamide-GDP ribazoletransferase|uniref:Adenosylcobinamide-GDP ribazoletransferase n=1 Tax=Nitrospira moscoviensis TaxID=42253 RepID=A0A0K2GAP0_NITMO|nr:adenosylcobinamide-GDP ribazoletransferase [Nitrospira moscoviensis]ALA58036.1 Cobalamin synthase [Nitrospira moscoviensis]MDI3461529.1 Cobalamin synthase [Nitrospira sp.]